MDIEVRKLQAGDRDLIAATNGGSAWHSGQERWDSYLNEQSRGERLVLIVLKEDCVVAYGSFLWKSKYLPFQASDIPEISDLVVAQESRQRGIATRLIADFEQHAIDAGRSVMGIGVGLYADYGAAQRLYPNLGYRPDGLGITHNYDHVVPGCHVRVDDDLILWMTKRL